jgi:hypothetical protein
MLNIAWHPLLPSLLLTEMALSPLWENTQLFQQLVHFDVY